MSTLWIYNGLDGVLINEREPEEAEMLLKQATKGVEKGLRPHQSDTPWVYHNLALVYGSVGRLDAEEQLHNQATERYKAALGLTHSDIP